MLFPYIEQVAIYERLVAKIAVTSTAEAWCISPWSAHSDADGWGTPDVRNIPVASLICPSDQYPRYVDASGWSPIGSGRAVSNYLFSFGDAMYDVDTWHAGASTDSGGKAVLMTHVKYNGVVPGKYYVVVSKFEPTRTEGGAASDPEADPEAYARSMGADVRTGSGGYDLVDLKFSKASPDVTIEVSEGS